MPARGADVEEAKKKEAKHHKNDDGSPGVNMNNRECTDGLMCVLFIGMLVVLVIIMGYAFGQGDLDKIATKYDMDGTLCPPEYPNKLFTRLMPRKYGNLESLDGGVIVPNAIEYYYGVCVEKCPTTEDLTVKWLPTKNGTYPADSLELSTWDLDTQVIAGFCMPSADKLSDMYKEVMKQMNEQMGTFAKYINDVGMSWKLILVMGIASFVFTLIYFFLLKWITRPILYVSLLLILIFGIAVTIWFYLLMKD